MSEHENANEQDHPGDDKPSSRDAAQSKLKDGGTEQKEPSKPSPLHKRSVRIALLVGAILVLTGGGVWFFNWWVHGRFVQTTNDAYLQADEMVVTSKVSGTIERLFVADNEQVVRGQPLVQIDDSSSRARVEQAEAQAEQASADINQYRAQIAEQQAAIAQSQAQVQTAAAKYRYEAVEVRRYEPLAASGAEKPEKLAQLISDRDQALATLHQDEAAELQAQRKIATLSTQIAQSEAKVKEAQAQARQAKVDVDSSLIKASLAGRVGDRAARVGEYVQSGTRLLTVVPIESLYLVANYKETQIGLMRVGQPATIKVDALDGQEIQGSVESFAPGTGAEFAVIPATNATGNFTKIVQRVPVRLKVEAGPEARHVLVPGLSVEVSVDTVGSKDETARQRQEFDASRSERKHRQDAQGFEDRSSRASGAGR